MMEEYHIIIDPESKYQIELKAFACSVDYSVTLCGGTHYHIGSTALGCAKLEEISKNPVLKDSIFENHGDLKLEGLAAEIQKALAETQSGEVAMPVMLNGVGIAIFARCDKRAPPPRTVFKLPTRSEIENRLFQEQIAAMARRHLRDLKRDASVQERGRDNPVVDAALVK